MAWQTDLWRTVVALLLKLVFICAELLGAMRDALGSLWPASESAFDAAATEELEAVLMKLADNAEMREIQAEHEEHKKQMLNHNLTLDYDRCSMF